MAAPLNFPYGCRYNCGSMLGQRNGNPRPRTYVRLQTGIFFMCIPLFSKNHLEPSPVILMFSMSSSGLR